MAANLFSMRIRHFRALVLIASLLALQAFADTPAASPRRYLNDVKILAAPDMEGRGAGTKGIERAAHYLEQQFKALGLEPAGNHSFDQPFTVTTGAKLKGKNDLIVHVGSVEKSPRVSRSTWMRDRRGVRNRGRLFWYAPCRAARYRNLRRPGRSRRRLDNRKASAAPLHVMANSRAALRALSECVCTRFSSIELNASPRLAVQNSPMVVCAA